jgi:hypothetical protein
MRASHEGLTLWYAIAIQNEGLRIDFEFVC